MGAGELEWEVSGKPSEDGGVKQDTTVLEWRWRSGGHDCSGYWSTVQYPGFALYPGTVRSIIQIVDHVVISFVMDL